MTQAVKPRRQYDSRRRREQAAQTRRDIEAAADKLFRERGYVGTSMPAIAAETGVVTGLLAARQGCSKPSLSRRSREDQGGPKLRPRIARQFELS